MADRPTIKSKTLRLVLQVGVTSIELLVGYMRSREYNATTTPHYRRIGFNCIVELLRLSLFSYIANLIIASEQLHVGVGY